ncbi:hypothetical protein GRS48_13880 [Halorubrum sp. JWXQ-INN 858]|uniref:hypothetical protein n=1 Tax=Halorubrum sp. JWXQ-INN 858 TaxID=2690782 RepID=UPI001357B950|nr:hypothetical protein [Halorubrum sp. JWXQ-INN 858]MWV65899.1 hypothetical protein [Halorubrum sp. JWXQ-INN 858]
MSDTVLTIGGELGDNSAMVYQNLDSLQFTDAASSMGSWSATVPFESTFADEIFNDVYIYQGGEILFRGEVESFDTNYSSGTTSVSGRGVLVALDRRTTSVSYSNTTVYDALQDAWANTKYDVNVLPPNRGLMDETHTSQGGLQRLWSAEGDAVVGITQDGVEVTPEGILKFTDTNVVLDDDFGGDWMATMLPDEPVDRVGMILETVDPASSMTAGIRSLTEEASAETIERAFDSVSHDTPQRFHIFEFGVDGANDRFRPILENGDELLEVRRSEVFAVDPDGYATIDELELDGTEFEILQELHDTGAYTFSVRDFATLDISAYPVGTLAGQPDWRVVDSTRTLDYTDYANRVTVHGRTRDDGTNTSTETNNAEVSRLEARGVGDNGVIEHFEKNADVETQAEVDSRAERLLGERINEKDESGSLEIAPQHISPGFTYSVSNWGNAFPYGGQIGASSLYFDGDSYVESTFRGDSNLTRTHEFVIHPQGLLELGDDEYQTLVHFDLGPFSGYHDARLYGDGSVEMGDSADVYRTRTESGVVTNDAPQRLSIVFDDPGRSVYIDGQLAEFFPRTSDTSGDGYYGRITSDIEGEAYWIGADEDENHGFVGGMDDVRLWGDEAKSGDWVFEHHNEDLIEYGADLDSLGAYLRFDDVSDTDSVHIDAAPSWVESTLVGGEYQRATGQLEEVQYSLGSGETISLNFDISGRIDTELIRTQRVSRSNRRSL